jgi:hypothetical protein
MPITGMASTTRNVTAESTDSAGRFRTRRTMAAQNLLPPPGCRIRASPGTRPKSTRSPRRDSRAGSTVTDPTTATRTTRIAAVPKPSKSNIPDRYMPAIATTTVRPETMTERPDVAAAILSAVRGSLPSARSSRSRRR